MKIFVLLSRVPYPIEKGDKLRAYHQIKYLAKKNEIILCALCDNKLDKNAVKELSKFCKSVTIIKLPKFKIFLNIIKSIFNGNPFQVGYFYNRKAKKIIDKIILEENPDHIFCQLLRIAEYVKNYNIPKTLDYQDVFSKGVERRIKNAAFLLKPFFKSEYKRLLKAENKNFDYFDIKTIISKPDRELIPHKDKDEIMIIRNGVDHEFFKPMQQEKEYDLVFIGNMGYPPNINGAEYIVKRILPLVYKKKPDIKLLIAGAQPHKKVMALKSDKVSVSGWVEDIRQCYAKSKIFIAPMQIGTGLQNKLLEAMSMKIPCITSSLANKALNAKENDEILVGTEPEEYAKHIIFLLDNKAAADKIALNGYNFVLKNYNWDNATKILEDRMFEISLK
ncbi:MAG: glycosyltransferase [Bacteroidales bacterium]|nr:glycosyltransferase [Bacteroidales bacterium]